MPLTILVVGGYGVFGARLCQLLAVDPRIALFVGGRDLVAAQALCQTLPPRASRTPLQFDRDGDVAAPLQRAAPDLLIDASGPFQSYGTDPYRLVTACLAHGVHYMDFADGSDFVRGIGQFDQQAKARGLFVLSGVSSFPVLTAAVVRHLSRDCSTVCAIRGGIAPSPFAVVGKNVLRAIAAYAGKPVGLVRDGRLVVAYPLTEGLRYTISPPGRLPLHSTYFSLVDVPDLQVLPQLWPGLTDVWMGAGTTPESVHRLLNALAWLVRLRLLPSLIPLAGLFLRVTGMLRWGEHRGGMFVEIDGIQHDGSRVTHSWHLLAEGNDGPFIPCMALQALVHRTLDGNPPPAGARAASAELEIADYDRLFQARSIFTGQRQSRVGDSPGALFDTLLGDALARLPAPVRQMHAADGDARYAGMAVVERGRGMLARLVAGAFRFPLAGKDIPVVVVVARERKQETWTRTFGGRSFSSILAAGTGRDERLLSERFGVFSFQLALVVEADTLRYVVRGWKLLGIALPGSWAPRGDSFESAKQGQLGFDIEIGHPVTGMIVRYSGALTRAAD